MQLQGWIFDLYPNPQGMTLWLIELNQKRHRLIDSFAPAFYVTGSPDSFRRLRQALTTKGPSLNCHLTERMDLWEQKALAVLEITVAHPTEYFAWTRWVHRFDGTMRLYNSDLMLAAMYCWEKKIFPLAFVEADVEGEAVRALKCRDSEWSLDYQPPPLEIMQIRAAGSGRLTSSCHSYQGLPLLDIEVDGRSYELDDADQPAAESFQRLLKQHDPDLILTDWGDAIILPQLCRQAARLRLSLSLNRDPDAQLQQSRSRSFMSYGRILYKDSATTLAGRLHVDARNSFIAGKCDLAGLWELVRVTKLPVQYAARTTAGTGISYMQMGLAYRDGVLIPEQKAEPEDPKLPSELLMADRGGLVFTPKIGFFPDVAELDFVSEYPSIMAKFNISPETVNCPCCPDAPRVPELGYRVCQQRRGITSRVVENLIDKCRKLKEGIGGAAAEVAQQYKLQRESLKWLLVCCFGYTGYKNARFGKIEAHEAINAIARESLLVSKEIAEDRGFELLHALVDSLYVRRDGATREDYEALAQEISQCTRLHLAVETVYRYAVFFPSRQFEDVPVPNRFFAVDKDGSVKVRGLESRRQDTPPLIVRMQQQVLAILAEANDYGGYCQKLEEAREILRRYEQDLENGKVTIADLIVSKWLTRAPRDYRKAGHSAIAAQQLYGSGVRLRPGQAVEYIITNAEARIPNDRVRAYAQWDGWHGYDRKKYAAMLREAFEPFERVQFGGIRSAAQRNLLLFGSVFLDPRLV